MKTNKPKPKASKKTSKSKRRSRYGEDAWKSRQERTAARAARIETDRSKAKARQHKLKAKARKVALNPPPALKAKLIADAKTAAAHALQRWLNRPDVTRYAADPYFVSHLEAALSGLIPENLVEP